MSTSAPLAVALRNIAARVRQVNVETVEDSDLLRDAAELLRVQARLMDGVVPIKAFGPPGDWGYETELGQALIVLRSQSCAATETVSTTQQTEREAFELALASKPDSRLWNTTDAMFWAWQARAALAQQDAQALPVTWADAERIADTPSVDEAIRALLDDQTGDNATALVQAVLNAALTPPAVIAKSEGPAT